MIKLITPTKAQSKVINAIENEEYKIYVIAAGRQSGKTELSKSLLVKWALTGSFTIWYVAPSYKRSKAVYRQIKNFVKDYNVLVKHNDAELFLEFISGSQIHFNSSESKDNLRGETLDYLVVDEFRYIEESIWDEILTPMLFVNGKKCLIISTPKGKGNLFHRLFLEGQGQNNNTKIKSFTFTSYDNPLIKKEDIDLQKTLVSEFIFKSEYLAEFVDSSEANVFRHIYECSTGVEGVYDGAQQYWAGVDVASVASEASDFSVVSIVNELGHLVYQEAYKGVDLHSTASWVAGVLQSWGEPNTLIETNGVGQAVFDTLSRMNIQNIHSFTTTSASKHQIVSNAIAQFNLKSIVLPIGYTELQNELKYFEIKMSGKGRATGYHTYGAPSGMHDDRVMSLLLALWSKEQTAPIKSSFYFGNGQWV